jgi:hypothetical protein
VETIRDVNCQWDIPVLQDLLQEIIPRKTTFEDIEVLHDFPDIGRITMLLNARRLDIEANKTQMILLYWYGFFILREIGGFHNGQKTNLRRIEPNG